MWTVFPLSFPSNLLLILYDVDPWNGKGATPVGLPLSVVDSCFLFMTLLKAAAMHPFCLNVFLRC
jgi:hypothetical protein